MTQLSDAFLLEGYRAKPPDNALVEVWIAQRSDGLAGSGTPNGPYHAGEFDAPLRKEKGASGSVAK